MAAERLSDIRADAVDVNVQLVLRLGLFGIERKAHPIAG